MIGSGIGVRVYLARGATHMRKGIAGLAVLTQDVLRQKLSSGAVFAFIRTVARSELQHRARGDQSWVEQGALVIHRDPMRTPAFAHFFIGKAHVDQRVAQAFGGNSE